MKTRLRIAAISALLACLMMSIVTSAREGAIGPMTVFVVRHAEKAADAGDPPLSAAGEKRAKALRHVLKSVKLSAVFTTDTVRAKQTATPVAKAAGLDITKYCDAGAVVTDVKANFAGKNVLIVGHSDTLPSIVQKLAGETAPIDIDDEFDNFFIVVICPSSTAEVHRLRYGNEP